MKYMHDNYVRIFLYSFFLICTVSWRLNFKKEMRKKKNLRVSTLLRWLRIHLPMQETLEKVTGQKAGVSD